MARKARLELEVDGSGARRGASEADRELQRLKKSARDTTDELRGMSQQATRTGRAADAAGKEIDGMRRATDRADRSMAQARVSGAGFAGSLRLLGGAATAVIALQLGRKFLEYADSAKQMDAQLRLSVATTTTFAAAQADVRRIASETRGGLEETTDLYGKFSRNSQELGKTQADAARATETFAKTLKISGAGTAEASAATTQFGQALASGVLRGDEFNTIMEASPRLSRLLADSLGVPVGALREMAAEGELTADKLYSALTDRKFTEAIDSEFKALPVTFSDAMVLINDAATVTFGAFDRGGAFSEMLVSFMLGGIENMDQIETRAEDLGIEVRAAFEGLGDAFDPLLQGALSALGVIRGETRTLGQEIAALLKGFDDIANNPPSFASWGTAPARFIERQLGWRADGPGPQVNTAGRFQSAYDRSRREGELRRDDRNMANTLPGARRSSSQSWSDFALGNRPDAPRSTPASAKPDGPKGRGASGKSEAEREAERLEKLAETRAQREAEFFQNLRNQVEIAKQLPEAAVQLNEELKLRAIINDGQKAGEREITEEQRKQIETLVKQREAANLLKDLRQAQVDGLSETLRLEERARVIATSTLETEEDNLELMERMWPFKLEAMQKGIDLQDETLKKTLAELEARERTNIALARKEKLLREGEAVAKTYRTPGMQQQDDLDQLGRDRKALDAAREAGRITPELYEAAKKGLEQAVFDTAHRFEYEMTDAIVDLAGRFDGELGGVLQKVAKVFDVIAAQSRGDFSKSGVIGGVINLFKGPNGNPVAEAATKASQGALKQIFSGSAFRDPLKSLSTGFGDFKGDLKNIFGKGGDFTKGLGSVLGKAGMGAAIGDATSGIMKALGIKTSNTGAQIGGAVGGAVLGPLGAIGGSILGGLVGGLFMKAKTGSAVISNTGVTTGGKLGGELTGTGGTVQDTIASIAKSLGAEIGAYSVAIGKREDYFRVSASGNASNATKKKYNRSDIIYDGKDEGAAIRAAIVNAIQDGAIKGLSPTLERVFRNAGSNFEKGLDDALKLKAVFDEFRNITDPVNFALEELNKGFYSIIDTLKAASGTSEEFSQIEKVYQTKRAEIIEQGNNGALKQMRDYLFALRGGTGSSLSPELRLSTARAELDRLDAARASGGKVDFGQYQSTADAFLAASRDSQGSTLGFFADLQRVTAGVEAMMEAERNKAVTAPAIDFTPLTRSMDTQTDTLAAILREIRDGVYAGGLYYGGSGSGGDAGSARVKLTEPRYIDVNSF